LATKTVTFGCKDAELFMDEIKTKVGDYFESRGLSIKANAAMVLKTFVIWGTFVAAYLTILSGVVPPLGMLGLAVVMGVALAGIGFSVAHDALHGAYSHKPWINRVIGYSFDVLGANNYMWRITHNVIHHTYTNIHTIDEDLEVSPLLRLSPHAAHRPYHRFQHLYALATYTMSTLNWVFWKDFDYFTRKNLGPYTDKKHPRVEVAQLVAFKLFFFLWSIVLPLAVLDLPLWQFAIGYLTMHLVAGLILGVVFQLAHVVEMTAHPVPDSCGHMEHTWAIHEMHTTANFATNNRLLTWYVGGLNHQIEHHLFPKTCSVHYPAIARIVREVAAKHGVPYYENRTFLGAVASHLRTLKAHGREPAAALEPQAVAA
jgi:linoleoyl-CoA desaturase